MKVGICTGGGDCPGLNAAIRAVVKHGINRHGMEFCGIYDSFNGLLERPVRHCNLDNDQVVEILHRGGTILGTYNKGSCFSGNEGVKKIQTFKEGFEHLGLDAMIVIGGEGTQGMSQSLIDAGIPVTGIPKTIDNDLPKTDTTIGYSSCVELVSESVTRLRSTAESHDRIMLLEVMGRDSGFIAMAGGLAGGANIILIPEIPFDYDKIVEKIRFRKNLGRNFSLVVISEGAMEKNGQQTFHKTPDGRKQLGGIGQQAATHLQKLTGMETRVTVLGHLQRGGQPNATDKVLATRFGTYAADLVAKGLHNQMVISSGSSVTHIPFSEIRRHERRKIDPDSPGSLIYVAEGIGISLGR